MSRSRWFLFVSVIPFKSFISTLRLVLMVSLFMTTDFIASFENVFLTNAFKIRLDWIIYDAIQQQYTFDAYPILSIEIIHCSRAQKGVYFIIVPAFWEEKNVWTNEKCRKFSLTPTFIGPKNVCVLCAVNKRKWVKPRAQQASRHEKYFLKHYNLIKGERWPH